MSGKQTIARAALILAAFTIIQKLLSVVQQISIAKIFGLTSTADAFYIAQIAPLLIGGLFLVATSTSVVSISSNSLTAGADAFTALFITIIVGSLAMALSCGLLAKPIVRFFGPGIAPGAEQMAIGLEQVMAPVIFFLPVAGALTGLFYARHQFLLPAAAGCLLYTGAVAGLCFHSEYGMQAVAWGLTAGAIAQTVLLFAFVEHNWFAQPTLDRNYLIAFGRVSFSVLSVAAVSLVYMIMDRSFAAHFPTGQIASYNIAGNLISVPSQIVSFSINTSLFPSLVALRLRRSRFGLLWGNTLVATMFVLLPTMLVIAIYSRSVIELLFHGKAFGAHAVEMTSTVAAAYSASIIGIALKDLCTTAFVAIGKYRETLLICYGSLALSFVLKLIFIPTFGPVSIAYSTSLASSAAGVILLGALWREIPLHWTRPSRRAGLILVLSSIVAAAIGMGGRRLSSSRGVIEGLVWIGVMIGTYVGICWVLKLPQLGLLKKRVQPA